MQAAIDAQVLHFSHGADVDLGFVYEKGALATGGAVQESGQARIGGRLPFAAPGPGFAGSTLEAVAGDGITVFADGDGWKDAAVIASRAFGVPVNLRDVAAYGPHAPGLLGIGTGGAVAARPDGHVLWISPTLPADPAEALKSAVAACYGRTEFVCA